jgi:hypothetical protein
VNPEVIIDPVKYFSSAISASHLNKFFSIYVTKLGMHFGKAVMIIIRGSGFVSSIVAYMFRCCSAPP